MGTAGNRLTKPGAKSHAWPETWRKSSHLQILKRGSWHGESRVPLGGGEQDRMARGCQAGLFAHHPAQISAEAAQAGRPLLLDVQSSRLEGLEGGSDDQAFPEYQLFLGQTP